MNKTLFKTLAACLLFLLPAVTLSAKPDAAAKVRQLIARLRGGAAGLSAATTPQT